MNALCPNCAESTGDVTDRTRDGDSGLEVSFACPECGHEWVVTV